MDNIGIKEVILAVVTINKEQTASGVPVFYARDEKERNKIALYLCKILSAMAHDLENGSYIIVRH
ncbi:capping complex subunit for YIEGIA [Thermoanaerobacterium sp. DL9XJH110]|uniref:capping complex subunit for YIEGIA n=1 Tax=Thermoanaerobacterium sp. DL9XJH110 TaxID=3386643 RepID=UPI003BB71481